MRHQRKLLKLLQICRNSSLWNMKCMPSTSSAAVDTDGNNLTDSMNPLRLGSAVRISSELGELWRLFQLRAFFACEHQRYWRRSREKVQAHSFCRSCISATRLLLPGISGEHSIFDYQSDRLYCVEWYFGYHPLIQLWEGYGTNPYQNSVAADCLQVLQ